MDLDVAQAEQRVAFAGGGVGAIVSGLVWLAAGIVTARSGIGPGFAALFFGGLLIFPVAAIACRFAMGRPGPAKDNPLGRVALESTIAMIGTLFVAYLMLAERPDLVLPIAAIGVGTHYFAFASVYGRVTYWALGAAVTSVGVAAGLGLASGLAPTAYSVAGVELSFGAFLVAAERREASLRLA